MAYEGTEVALSLGDLGLITDISSDKVVPGALVRANNVYFSNGCVEKAPGGLRWNQTPLDSGVIAVHYWRPTLEVSRFIAVTSNGNIYKGQDRQFGSAINSSVASVLTPNCIFSEGGAETAGRAKKLFLFTEGATNPLVLSGDGTAFASLSGPASDWTSTGTYPKFGVVHRNRLWAFAGQISYASDSGDHESFNNTTTSLTEPVYPGEGGELRGGFVYKGKLFSFKDGGFVYILNDTNDDDGLWFWQKIGSNFGLAAPNAIDEVLDDFYAGNTSGTLNSYAATQKLGDVSAGDLVQELQFEQYLRGNTSDVGVPFQHVLYYAKKKLLFATYRSCYRTTNDMLLVFDFGRSGAIRPSFWLKGTPQCLATYLDVNKIERPMYGDADGYVVLMDQEDRIEGGASYTGEFQLPHHDFGFASPDLAVKQKHFDFIAVHYVPEGDGTLLCDYFIDGRYIDTVTFQMVQYQRPKLNVLTLNTDRLAQPTTETCIRPARGTGRTFSARFYNAGSNESFKITKVTVFFRGGAEEATKE